MTIFSIIDFIMIPFSIFIIWNLGNFFKKNIFNEPEIRKYFMPALFLRLSCAILTALLYTYYYGYGDTFEYYKGGEVIKTALLNSDFGVAWELMFGNYNNYSSEATRYMGDIWQFNNTSNRFVMCISAIFSLLTFSSFISISLFFTFFSSIGSWLIFLTFYSMNKTLAKPFSYAVLFVPSFLFWGSGIMKEPICIFGLGGIFYATNQLILKKEFRLKYFTLFLISAFLLFQVKVYILISFLIACIPWITAKLRLPIKSFYVRTSLKFIFLLILIFITTKFYDLIGSSFQAFASPENILEQLDYTQTAQIINSEGGSGYELDEILLTPFGISSYAISAVHVSLFRPSIFEINKPINIPMALESMIMLLLTLYTFFKVGILRTLKFIFSETTILFCIIFTLVLGIIVGATSFNFGTLARYRTPFLPFYFAALILILNKGGLIKSQVELTK